MKSYPMSIREFGKNNPDIVILLHADGMTWMTFQKVWPLLKLRYHLIVPVIPGHDLGNDGRFTSVEEIAKELETWLLEREYHHIHGIYGVSMGGAIAAKFIMDNKVKVDAAVLDAGVLPCRHNKTVSAFITIKDFFVTQFASSNLAIEHEYPEDRYSSDYVGLIKTMRQHMGARSIFRTVDKMDNYTLPSKTPKIGTRIQYWYGSREAKERKDDIERLKQILPTTELVEVPDMGHAEYLVHQVDFCAELVAFFEADNIAAAAASAAGLPAMA